MCCYQKGDLCGVWNRFSSLAACWVAALGLWLPTRMKSNIQIAFGGVQTEGKRQLHPDTAVQECCILIWLAQTPPMLYCVQAKHKPGCGECGIVVLKTGQIFKKPMKSRAKRLNPMENKENIHTSPHEMGWLGDSATTGLGAQQVFDPVSLWTQHKLAPATPKVGFISILALIKQLEWFVPKNTTQMNTPDGSSSRDAFN